jgi:hypothetical protein
VQRVNCSLGCTKTRLAFANVGDLEAVQNALGRPPLFFDAYDVVFIGKGFEGLRGPRISYLIRVLHMV